VSDERSEPSFNELLRQSAAEPRSRTYRERISRPAQNPIDPLDDGEREQTYGRPRPQPKKYEQVVDDEGVKSMGIWDLDDLTKGD
jgi:hypothetical protein